MKNFPAQLGHIDQFCVSTLLSKVRASLSTGPQIYHGFDFSTFSFFLREGRYACPLFSQRPPFLFFAVPYDL